MESKQQNPQEHIKDLTEELNRAQQRIVLLEEQINKLEAQLEKERSTQP